MIRRSLHAGGGRGAIRAPFVGPPRGVHPGLSYCLIAPYSLYAPPSAAARARFICFSGHFLADNPR